MRYVHYHYHYHYHNLSSYLRTLKKKKKYHQSLLLSTTPPPMQYVNHIVLFVEKRETWQMLYEERVSRETVHVPWRWDDPHSSRHIRRRVDQEDGRWSWFIIDRVMLVFRLFFFFLLFFPLFSSSSFLPFFFSSGQSSVCRGRAWSMHAWNSAGGGRGASSTVDLGAPRMCDCAKVGRCARVDAHTGVRSSGGGRPGS